MHNYLGPGKQTHPVVSAVGRPHFRVLLPRAFIFKLDVGKQGYLTRAACKSIPENLAILLLASDNTLLGDFAEQTSRAPTCQTDESKAANADDQRSLSNGGGILLATLIGSIPFQAGLHYPSNRQIKIRTMKDTLKTTINSGLKSIPPKWGD